MAMPNPLLSTALTAGATTHTLTKLADGQYAATVSSVPLKVQLRIADPMKQRRAMSVNLKHDPSVLDSPAAATLGKCSINVNMSYTLGSTITIAAVKSLLTEIASIVIQDAVITALDGGSYA